MKPCKEGLLAGSGVWPTIRAVVFILLGIRPAGRRADPFYLTLSVDPLERADLHYRGDGRSRRRVEQAVRRLAQRGYSLAAVHELPSGTGLHTTWAGGRAGPAEALQWADELTGALAGMLATRRSRRR